MNGDLDSDAPDQVEALLAYYPALKWIELEDCPGSVDDMAALEAARKIRSAGLNTRVPADGEIASGAVDFFIAGVQRVVVEGGMVGVHAWRDGSLEGSAVPQGDPEHDLYLDFYAELGIDREFYWFTLQAAPADGLHYMTQEELEQYGLINLN